MVESETGGVIRVRFAGVVREDGIEYERFFVGSRVPSSTRTVFPYQPKEGDVNQVTGSIGFLDMLTKQNVYDVTRRLFCNAVEIVRIGIEPLHCGHGYGVAMVEVAADKAAEDGIGILVAREFPRIRFPGVRSIEQLGLTYHHRFSFPLPGQHVPTDEEILRMRCYPFYATLPLQIPEPK